MKQSLVRRAKVDNKSDIYKVAQLTVITLPLSRTAMDLILKSEDDIKLLMCFKKSFE